MNFFLSLAKSQGSIISIFTWLLVFILISYRLKKRKLTIILTVTGILFFYISTTAIVPQFFARRLEAGYTSFNPASLQALPGTTYIHVLGSGANNDERLAATAQLGQTAQGRLMEGLRLYKQLPNSILVVSGSGGDGFESQAVIAKRAALLLGADSSRIITLETPTTTEEEARALFAKTGANIRLLVVTDAMHMPRATALFKRVGFSPIAAPSSFRSIEGKQGIYLPWWPSISHLTTSEIVLHEYLGRLKAAL